MKNIKIKQVLLSVLCLLAVLTTAFVTNAGGYEPANSLEWPLWNVRQNPMTERTRIWTSLGEIQDRTNYAQNALHSGNDFRGAPGDVVKAVAPGNVWFTHKLRECQATDTMTNNYSCRIYILGKPTNDFGEEVPFEEATHQYVYYYSHLWWGDNFDSQNTLDDAIVSSETREALENAQPGSSQPYEIKPNTEISSGQAIARIAYFHSVAKWHHLHFGIYDRLKNYNAVPAISALKKNDNSYTFDAEDPAVHDVFLMTNENANPTYAGNSTQPVGECGEIPRYEYDIVAEADDRFEREEDLNAGVDGDGWWVPGTKNGERISINEAMYIIRNVETGKTNSYTWFNFNEVPFECIGDSSTWDTCPEFSDQDFWNNSIDEPGASGAAIPALPYADILYNEHTEMASAETEGSNYLILTNTWGVDQFWDATDTTKYPDGQYQVTARVYDQSGRMHQKTKWVYLGDGSTCQCEDLPSEIYVRDNLEDDGAVPTLDPHWLSQDIVILDQSSGRPATIDTARIASGDIEVGTTYNVWVRVHRLNCAGTPNIQAKVMALNPSMYLDPDNSAAETEHITDNQYKEGDSVFEGFTENGSDDFEYVGPFEWTPTKTGHRCLIARIKFENETGYVEGDLVAYDNRFTQRNLQDVDSASNAYFTIPNPNQQPALIAIAFDARNFPIWVNGANVVLTVEYNQALYNAWNNVPGTTLTTNANGDIELKMHGSKMKMPPATLPALTYLDAWVDLELPDDYYGKYEVYFAEWLNGEILGGMSFSINNVYIE